MMHGKQFNLFEFHNNQHHFFATNLKEPSAPLQYVTPLRLHQLKEDSDSENDFETWSNILKGKNYGEVGARTASVKWFKTTHAKQLLQENGFYADWFHGIISRRWLNDSNDVYKCYHV